MMSFFASPYCAAPAPAETSFTPLFRLLDDFESYQQQQATQQHNGTANPTQRRRRAPPRPAVQPTFRPKFDIRETEHTYELHGELAGLERDNLEIEFADPQTLVIRGRVERTYENKPASTEEEKGEVTPAITNNNNNNNNESDAVSEKTKRRSSYQATVEDDPEEPSTPISTPPESPKTQPADLNKQQKQAQKAPAPQAPAPVAPQSKYWLYERSIGQFSRAFEFPTRVDHEGVKATLDNGILTVSVPKAKRHEVRRIAIF